MSRDTVLILLVLAAGVWLGMQLKVLLWQMKRGSNLRWDKRRGKDVPFQAPKEKAPDAAAQLRTVMRADFKAQPLLNKSEARLFKALDKMVIEMRPGWQVMMTKTDHAPHGAGFRHGQPGRNPQVRGQGRLSLHKLKARRPADRR